ncbi:MAG: MOSC domain-containing protein [Acidobacteriota bacterium]
MTRTLAELEAGLDHVARSPEDQGCIELIVRRPAIGAREVLGEASLSPDEGLVGDTWRVRPSSRTPDRRAHPDKQLTIMNARVIALIAGEVARWPLAGDQLFVDLDLSVANLPAGSRLALGESAVIEISPLPHTGCGTFASRFGVDALKLVNGSAWAPLRLRGLNARVVRDGVIRVGDLVSKVSA